VDVEFEKLLARGKEDCFKLGGKDMIPRPRPTAATTAALVT
jgi:hypothetical protein